MAFSTLSIRQYVANLSGRRLGAFKRAAAIHGFSVDQYVSRLESGDKWCIDCKTWKSRSEFCSDTSRWDGLSCKCRQCSSRRGKEYHACVPLERLGASGPQRSEPRDNDKDHARHLVNLDVRRGSRPNPNELFCAMCGHKGGDKRHEYHHHMGYGKLHVYDVVALCSSCHHEAEK